MSLKTKILGLFKYDPDKDGASTFNIKQALNDNWDKLDNEVAARVKTTELASEVKKTVKGGSLTASDLGAVLQRIRARLAALRAWALTARCQQRSCPR